MKRNGSWLDRRQQETAAARCDAFTLIEMLAVLAVIAILAGVLLPVISKAVERGRATVCLGNLRQIGIALQIYVQDNDNRLPVLYDRVLTTNPAPSMSTADLVLSNDTGSTHVFECPSDDRNLFTDTGSSYSWNVLANGQDADRIRILAIPFHAHQVPLMFDKESFHRARGPGKGVNYLYADGHIRNLLVLDGRLP